MGNYVRILEEVEAVQATETNIEELRKLGGLGVKKVIPDRHSASYYTIPGINIVLWVGSWLIKHPSGMLEVKSSQLFHRDYHTLDISGLSLNVRNTYFIQFCEVDF